MKMTAGIHTVEILAKSDTPISEIKSKPYFNRTYRRDNGELAFRFNPHKFTDNGKQYCCVYGSLNLYTEIRDAMINKYKLEGWRYNRVDVCVDNDMLFSETAKLNRLFIMLISNREFGNVNLYQSVDPLTNRDKSVNARNQIKTTGFTMEVANYDRSYFDQTAYDRPVGNRLEFRLTGKGISSGMNTDEVAIINKWIAIIADSIKDENIANLEQKLALNTAIDIDSRKVDMNEYARCQSECMYTRRQYIDIMRLNEKYYNKSEKQLDGAMRTQLTRNETHLFTNKEIKTYGEQVIAALNEFKNT